VKRLAVKRLALIAALLLVGMSGASAQYSKSCGMATTGRNCTYTPPTYGLPQRTVGIEMETDADRAARVAREAEWTEFCQPRVVVGADGISRYVYAHKNCEHGATGPAR
jgi:hypothetical protein